MDDARQFVFDLQRFGDGPNAGGDDGGKDSNKNGKEGQTSGDDDGKKVEFTPEQQAHIDQLIGQRLKRAESAAAKKALEEKAKALGFESAEAMEEALRAHKEAQEKQKTDLQKAQEAKAAAEAQARAAQEQAKKALIQAALMTAAAQANFADPQDAVRMADASEIEVKDDGTVTGAKEAVEALAKAKPYLLRQGGGAAGGAGGNPSRGGPQVDQNVERAREEAARRNRGPAAGGGYDPWGGPAGQQDTERLAQAVAVAVATALNQKG